MSYTIKLTNDTTLAVIADQTYDQVSTSIVLVGKNLNNYGEYLNNNFVGLLENFADIVEPRSPLVGQTWFDKSEGRLKVYSTGTFKPVGGPIISSSEPANAVRGDLWLDTSNGILKWYNGTLFVDASKSYSDTTGKEGWIVETITDIENNDLPVARLYSNGTAIAISTVEDVQLNPYVPYFGTTTIRAGITLNPGIPGIRFIGTATEAERVAGFSAEDYLLKDVYQVTTGELDISNNDGISVGTLTNIAIYVDTTSTKTSVIEGTIANEPMQVRYNNSASGASLALHIDSRNNRIGLFTDTPEDDLDVDGDVTIRGNLNVLGNQTSLQVSVIEVEDKNIELGVLTSGTPTNATAEGGGIILKGDTDHQFLYASTSQSWTSSINLNVAAGKKFMIGGISAIEEGPSGLSLGTGVVHAPSLTDLPVLSQLTVSNIVLYANTLTTVASPLTDLYIMPSSEQINLGTTTKIVGMKPTLDGDPDDSAITKKYFEDKISLALGGYVGRKPYTLSIDITDFGNVEDEIIAYLDITLPVDGFGNPYYAQPDGSRCSVLCTKYIATTATYVIENLNTSTVRTLLNYVESIQYTNSTGTNTSSYITTATTATQLVVTDFELAGQITVSSPQPIIERTVKLFVVAGGYWTFDSDYDPVYLTSNTPKTIQTATILMTVNKQDLVNFNTGTTVIVRETDTQSNYMTGPITAWSGTDITINVTEAYDTANTGTFSSWLIKKV